MKSKIIFLLVFVLCLVSVAFGITTIIVTDTVKPSIEATFNETVSIASFSLNKTATDEKIDMNYVSADPKVNKSFTFTPKIALANGYYLFLVKANDKIGNLKEFRRNVIINVNETSIRYINPTIGISSQTIFNVLIGTSRQASCRWSNFDKPYSQMSSQSFTTTGTTQHTINNFPSAQNIQSKQDDTTLPKIYVACNDTLERVVKKAMPIGYDSSPPAFSVSVEGLVSGKVINHPPAATLRIIPDPILGDRVVCTAKDLRNNQLNVFMGQNKLDITTYKKGPEHTITYADDSSSNGVYDYDVTCDNLAGLSVTKRVSISVELIAGMGIVVNKPTSFLPGAGDKGELVYDITTNQEANCEATLDGDSSNTKSLTKNAAGTSHTLLYGLIEKGNHIAKFECVGERDSKVTDWTFFVDVTSPTPPTANATACMNDKLSLSFSSQDLESQIKGYNYTVYSGANTTVPSKFTTVNKVVESGLNLKSGISYTVDVTAINGAGMLSKSLAAASFTFSPNTTIECQERNPPTVTLNITDSQYGKQATIVCKDESGCDPLSIKYGLTETKNCTATIYGSQATLQKSQTMCWEAADVWGNKAIGSRFVEISVTGGELGSACTVNSDCAENYCVENICKKPLCSDVLANGFESDVDCGGPVCNACVTGKVCLKDTDCSTNYCNINLGAGVCDVSSCTDTIKNGLESDIDCGGNSCGACTAGKSCTIDTDCESKSCQFSTCVGQAETFEDWAVKNGISPDDKDGDTDGDGLSNYDEFLNKTNPNNADTDGDGWSDGDEISAGTNPLDANDFPITTFYRYLLTAVGVLIILLAAFMFYYLKADPSTSLNIALIGIAALVFVVIDWLMFLLPKSVLIVVSLAAIGGASFLTYKQKEFILQKGSGKQSVGGTSSQKNQEAIDTSQQQIKVSDVKRAREEFEATKVMIDMLKRQKSEKERAREAAFGKFSSSSPKNEEPIRKSIEPIKKTQTVKQKITKLELPKKETTEVRKESDMERLGKVGKNYQLSSLDRTRRKEEAFDKLSSFSKSRVEDVFNKLPASSKNIEDLDKEKKKKSKK